MISLFIIGTERSRKSINNGITRFQFDVATVNKRGKIIEMRQTITSIDQFVILSIQRHVIIKMTTNSTSLNNCLRWFFSNNTTDELSLSKGCFFSQNAKNIFPTSND